MSLTLHVKFNGVDLGVKQVFAPVLNESTLNHFKVLKVGLGTATPIPIEDDPFIPHPELVLTWPNTYKNASSQQAATLFKNVFIIPHAYGANTGIEYTDDDGVTYNFSNIISGDFTKACQNGDKVFVASQRDQGILSSSDGKTWGQTSLTSGSFTWLVSENELSGGLMIASSGYCLSANNNLSGEPGTTSWNTSGLWYSDDNGISWNQSNITSGAFTKAVLGKDDNGNNRWVVASKEVIGPYGTINDRTKFDYSNMPQSTGIYYSNDGKTWQHSNLTTGRYSAPLYNSAIGRWAIGSCRWKQSEVSYGADIETNYGLKWSNDGATWYDSESMTVAMRGLYKNSEKAPYDYVLPKTITNHPCFGSFNDMYIANGRFYVGSFGEFLVNDITTEAEISADLPKYYEQNKQIGLFALYSDDGKNWHQVEVTNEKGTHGYKGSSTGTINGIQYIKSQTTPSQGIYLFGCCRYVDGSCLRTNWSSPLLKGLKISDDGIHINLNNNLLSNDDYDIRNGSGWNTFGYPEDSEKILLTSPGKSKFYEGPDQDISFRVLFRQTNEREISSMISSDQSFVQFAPRPIYKYPDTTTYNYLNFTAKTANSTVSLQNVSGDYVYSTDYSTWNDYELGTVITLENVNDKVYFAAKTENKTCYSNDILPKFQMTGLIETAGNIQSLLDRSCRTTLVPNSCYKYLFANCSSLINTPNIDQVDYLSENCYYGLFKNCTSLTSTPTFNIYPLRAGCYEQMFSGCTALSTIISLPAAILAENCYANMFENCAVKTLPELKVQHLADNCCKEMFKNCNNLSVSNTPVENVRQWSVSINPPVSETWNKDMLVGTAGSFTSDPQINTTYYIESDPVGAGFVMTTVNGNSYGFPTDKFTSTTFSYVNNNGVVQTPYNDIAELSSKNNLSVIDDSRSKFFTSIAANCCKNCTGLRYTYLPEITKTNDYAFYGCTNLLSIDVPKLNAINQYSFQNCSNLSSIDFPNVTSIEQYGFSKCSKLSSVDFPNLTSIGQYCFEACSKLLFANLPNVTSITSYGFADCSNLSSVNLSNITSIGQRGFRNCSKLSSVDFPNLTSISEYAFYGCSKLATIILSGDTLCTLKNVNAFGSMLTSYIIYVPDSLYNNYLTATNWSNSKVKGHIHKISEKQ